MVNIQAVELEADNGYSDGERQKLWEDKEVIEIQVIYLFALINTLFRSLTLSIQEEVGSQNVLLWKYYLKLWVFAPGHLSGLFDHDWGFLLLLGFDVASCWVEVATFSFLLTQDIDVVLDLSLVVTLQVLYFFFCWIFKVKQSLF